MFVRRTAAALLGAAVLLAGCSGDPEPTFVPTESPSPSESETTAEPEAQTPEEFIEEWFALNTEMQNTGQTDAFLATSPNCEPCKKLAAQVARFYGNGGFIRVEDQQVRRVKHLQGSEYSVTVSAAPTEYKSSASADLTRLPGGPNEYRMFIRQQGTQWLMTEYLDTPS